MLFAHVLTLAIDGCILQTVSKKPPYRQRDMLLREMQLLKMLDHPNIIKVVEIFRSHTTLQVGSHYVNVPFVACISTLQCTCMATGPLKFLFT